MEAFKKEKRVVMEAFKAYQDRPVEERRHYRRGCTKEFAEKVLKHPVTEVLPCKREVGLSCFITVSDDHIHLDGFMAEEKKPSCRSLYDKFRFTEDHPCLCHKPESYLREGGGNTA